MTKIITAVMMKDFSMPRTMFHMFLEKKHFGSLFFSTFITFANDDIMALQWMKLQAKLPLWL